MGLLRMGTVTRHLPAVLLRKVEFASSITYHNVVVYGGACFAGNIREVLTNLTVYYIRIKNITINACFISKPFWPK
jgi:hypothetical protein